MSRVKVNSRITAVSEAFFVVEGQVQYSWRIQTWKKGVYEAEEARARRKAWKEKFSIIAVKVLSSEVLTREDERWCIFCQFLSIFFFIKQYFFVEQYLFFGILWNYLLFFLAFWVQVGTFLVFILLIMLKVCRVLSSVLCWVFGRFCCRHRFKVAERARKSE